MYLLTLHSTGVTMCLYIIACMCDLYVLYDSFFSIFVLHCRRRVVVRIADLVALTLF